MGPGGLIACALLRLAAGQVATYELGAGTEVRGVYRLQAGVGTWLAELDLAPRAALKVESRTLGLDASYTPRFWGTTTGGNLRVLQGAAVGSRYQPDPRWIFTLGASGNMGEINMLAPAVTQPLATTPPSLQAVGRVTQVHYVFADGVAGLDVMPTRRTRLVLQAGYRVSGGDGAVARASVPLQYGPRAGLTFELGTSASDLLTTAATLSSSHFDTSPPYPGGPPVVVAPVWIGQFTEIWRRRIDAETSTWAGLGAAWVGHRIPVSSLRVEGPVLDAGVQRLTQGGQGKFRLSGRYAPVVDPVTGVVYMQADLYGSAGWAFSATHQLAGTLNTGVGAQGKMSGQVMMSGEVKANHVVARGLDLAWGLRALWQRPANGSTALTYRQWVLFVDLIYLYRDTL